MKKLLSFIAVSAVLSGSALISQPISSPLVRPDNVKHYNSITSAVNVQYAISETISSHPCDYYATGDDLVNFYAIIKNLIDTVKPSDESISQFCNSIKALGSVVDQYKADYSALKTALVQESITLFNVFGLNLVINSDNTCSLINPTSNVLMVDSFPYLAPLPLALNYVASSANGSVTTYTDLAVSPITSSQIFGSGASQTVLGDVIEYGLVVGESGVDPSLKDIQNKIFIYQYENFFKKNHSYRINMSNTVGNFGRFFKVTNNVGINIDDLITNVSIVDPPLNGEGHISFDVIDTIPEGVLLFLNQDVGTYFDEGTQDDLDVAISEYNRFFTGDTCVLKSIEDHDNTLHDGQTKNIYLDVDNNYTQEQIVAEVSAEDLFGVSVPVTVKSSDYEVGKTGVFNIILEATDAYGQKATATLIVNVGDYAKPTIVKKNEVIYTYGTALTESMLLQNFTFSDNMGTAGLTYSFTYPTGFDISKSLVFGNYSLTVTATDAYGNSTSLDFILSVVDETMPVITKKDGQMSDKVGIGYSALNENTVSWILSLYKATDAIDGNCSVYLKEGKIPSGIVGDFSLLIAAKDKSNNEALATITCEIIADIPPVFILSDKLVNSTADNPLTLEDLVRVVQNGLLRSVRAANVSVNASGYLANSTKVGSYPVSYTYTDLDTNETKTDSFIMKVTDNSELPVDEPKDNWFVDAFKTVFSKNIDKATATDWMVVVGTFVVGIALIVLIVSLFKPKKKYDYSKYRRR